MVRKVIDLRKKKPGFSRSHAATSHASAAARRASPLRARRRKMRIYGAAIACVMFIAALPYVSEFTYSERFALKEVSVAGVSRVPAKLVKAFFEKTLYDGANHFFSRANIFWYPKDALEKGILAGIPRVKNVHIRRGGLLAQAVLVTVEERKRYGVWCGSGGACFEMDETGFIFAPAQSERGAQSYIFSGAIADGVEPIGEMYLIGHMKNVFAFLGLLENKGLKPRHISSDGADDFWVELESGVSIRAPLRGAPEELARNLELALSSEVLRGQTENLEYIDLRFGNKLYYKTR